MKRKFLFVWLSLALLVGLLIVFATACSSDSGRGNTSSGANADATPTPIPTSVVPSNPTYTVGRGPVIREVQFSARIAPVREEELFFKMGGYVDTIYIRRGAEVLAGDLLAELEVTDLKNQIVQKEAELIAVQMDYDRRVAEARANVRARELNLAKLEASMSAASWVSSRINLERAHQNLANAQDEYNKSLAREWEEETQREHYRLGVRDMQWNLEISEAQYGDVLRARERTGYDIELAQQDLDLTLMRLAEIEIGLDITRTVLSLQRLKDQLNDARIVAPFDGVILQISIVDGKQIQGYQPMLTLADITELEVSADLMDSEMSELTEELAVVAEFVNRPGVELLGFIRRLPYPYGSTKPAAGVDDDDKSARLTLPRLAETNINYDVGDRLRITVELERVEDVLRLPPQAVRTFEGRTFVVAQQAGGQRRVDVRLGIQATDWLEIQDGLEEGQVVIAP